jgi:hypothetical protein
MTSKAVRVSLHITAALTLLAGPLGAIEGVSPGAAERIMLAPGGCPTFSWELDENASLYELAVFAIAESEVPEMASGDQAPYRRVLYRQLPGKASSWSPSAGECLTPGGQFVWFVRSV